MDEDPDLLKSATGALNGLKEREKLKDALQRSNEQTKTTNEMLAAARIISEKFYYQVALLCGGTIVLSVTFLGYLESSGKEIRLLPLLLSSWAVLLAALLGALYRNHQWMRQIHFQAVNAYLVASRESAEQTLQVTSADPSAFVNIRTHEELKDFQEREKNKAEKLRKNEKWHSVRAERAERLTLLCEWVAHSGLIVGLTLLLIFAGGNVWMRTEDSLHRISASGVEAPGVGMEKP